MKNEGKKELGRGWARVDRQWTDSTEESHQHRQTETTRMIEGGELVSPASLGCAHLSSGPVQPPRFCNAHLVQRGKPVRPGPIPLDVLEGRDLSCHVLIAQVTSSSRLCWAQGPKIQRSSCALLCCLTFCTARICEIISGDSDLARNLYIWHSQLHPLTLPSFTGQCQPVLFEVGAQWDLN
jgi:hypothetical protein